MASVNLQPEHKAVLEGDREIVLTEQETLRMRVAGLDLHLRPQSFFQTNTAMAAELYARARAWTADLAPASVWDLYCGVGGFALSLARPGVAVTGIEVSREAVASASLTAAEAGLVDVRFEAGDATAYAVGSSVAARPGGREPASTWDRPGAERLAGELGRRSTSSTRAATPQTLAKDLAAMPSLRPVRGQLLDMFPNTGHYEVLTLLERR